MRVSPNRGADQAHWVALMYLARSIDAAVDVENNTRHGLAEAIPVDPFVGKLPAMLADLPQRCDIGAKKNSQG